MSTLALEPWGNREVRHRRPEGHQSCFLMLDSTSSFLSSMQGGAPVEYFSHRRVYNGKWLGF